MDDDRLGVGVCRRAKLACHGEHSPLGGFVGLEPLVQPLVSDFKGTSECAEQLGIGFLVPGGAQELD